jgi:exopolysaccharide biosynthesis polyprenyl glycosylphosphotransferase
MIDDRLMRQQAGGLAGAPRAIGLRGRPHDPIADTSSSSPIVASRYGARDAAVRRLLAASDLAGVSLSLLVALVVLSDRPDQFLWGLLMLPLWWLLFKAYGLYGRDMKRVSGTSLDDLPQILHAVLVGCFGLFAFYRVAPPNNVDVTSLAIFGATATMAIVALRTVARRLGVAAFGPERVLLLGDGEKIPMLARKMRAHPEYGVEPVGCVSRSPSPPCASSLQLLGQFATLDLPDLVARHRLERIVVSHEEVDEVDLLDLVHRCHRLGVKVSVVPQLFDAMGPSLEIDDVEGVTLLGINPPVLSRSSRLAKRAMDVVGSCLLLTITAPLQLAVAIAIVLDSPGPIFFRQRRIGRGGRCFRFVKFRTMTTDAELRRDALLAESRDPGWLHLERDPRVTRVGRWLRLSSIDELPQLWNVLKGEMSLVGPRPLIESEDRQLDGWRRSRVDLTPGLTGLWQVLGRTNIPFDEMIKLDYLYVTNWSLWTDIRLMLRTTGAVLMRRGAN